MSVFFSVQAEADLEGIADYIAADSPARALSFVSEIRKHCNKIGARDLRSALSDESPENHNHSPESLGGITTRIIFTVADPDAVFARAIAAGAKEVFPVSDEHGWRVGRVVDPFGHHWEIARPLE